MKYQKITSIGQGKTPEGLTSYIIDVPAGTLEKDSTVLLNNRLFKINRITNKKGNPKTRISGHFL